MALPDTIGLVGGTSRASGIAAAAVQSDANYLGSAIDNATHLEDLADIELVWSYSVAPTAGKTLAVYALYAMDGSNYENGAGNGTGTGDVDPLPGCLIGTVSPPAATGTYRRLLGAVPLLPYPLKLLVANVSTGQTATVSVNVTSRKAAQVTD